MAVTTPSAGADPDLEAVLEDGGRVGPTEAKEVGDREVREGDGAVGMAALLPT